MPTSIRAKQNNFLSGLLAKETSLNGKSDVIKNLRQKGLEGVKNNSFPRRKDEDWQFINLRDLYTGSYIPASQIQPSVPDLSEHYIPESDGARLVFINGRFSTEHSATQALPGEVRLGNIANLAANDNELISRHLNEYGDFDDDIFSSFNTALLTDGAFIHIPEGTKVEVPVHLLFVQTDADEPYFTTSRCLVLADRNTELTLIEDHIGQDDNKYFSLPVVELNLERGAFVKHTKIQRESNQAIHIARTAVHIKQHANYESYTITIGAKLSRNEPRIVQLEEDTEFTVDGLVLIDGNQVSDTHSVMDHRFGQTTSHQLHKCVINGRAHSVFNGKIFVRQDAQKIDSFQENRNLLLSRKGLVNTKPQLEIFADDVKCTHGATIGQLEEDEVFYLKSRGLSDQQARELLTYAFALETIENITVESVQKLLVNEVHQYTSRSLEL
jgi:Fe-S cluster assembly protein SufD